MKLIFLGTSAARPTSKRALSCVCLERKGEILMFDAGEAAQFSFQRAGLGWNKKMKIFVTHMHGDHCVGILGLLQTMNMQGRTEPLDIYGPDGIEEFVAQNVKVLNFGVTFPVSINTIKEGTVFDSQAYSVLACRANHSVASFAYLFRENKPRKFHPEKAMRLGIPRGKAWGQLQKGSSITQRGQEITPDQVLGEQIPGQKIGVSGDTMPTAKLEEFFDGCDYLVFDSTFLDELKDKAVATGHSTAMQAATLARNAGVKNLILTHFSARYKDESGHIEEAGRIHGSVIAARDLLEVEIS